MSVIFTTANSSLIANSNAMIGKYAHPIKSVIQHESDVCAKNDDLVRALFEVMKSNRYGEAFITQNEFDLFTPTAEGGSIPKVAYSEVKDKLLQHTQFTSQFAISKVMMEDSLINQMRAMAEKFTRSFYRTRNLFATKLLVGAVAGAGENTTVEFGSKGGTQRFDITTADGKALFHKAHGTGDAVESNRFHTVLNTGVEVDAAVLDSALSAAVEAIRNFKDESGNAMGYVADTIMIPGNDRKLESALKKLLGSEYGCAAGGSTGLVNLHYGNWTLIVNPLWQRDVVTAPHSHPMMVFSSAARRNLNGAVFLDRVPLEVTDHMDPGTENYIWNGRSRWSAGFITHKFACLVDILDNDSAVSFDGQNLSGDSAVSTLLTL